MLNYHFLGLFLALAVMCLSGLAATDTAIPREFNDVLKLTGERETDPFLIVDAGSQRMLLFRKRKISRAYVISTADRGLGARENSFQTPPGLHRIADKIGSRAPLHAIFYSRKDTGRRWDAQRPEVSANQDLILTRIMRLQGLESGLNQGYSPYGYSVDSYERYIYIHGTNHEKTLGTACSQGCIRMASEDVSDLFEQVPSGTLVWITPSLASGD